MPNANMLDVRYVILGKKKYIDNFDHEEFELIRKIDCWFSDEHMIAEIKANDKFADYTLEDVMDITDSLAVHEEYTNGIITTKDSLDELNSIYCWSGAGGCLLADMLTEVERLSCILRKYYIETKERIDIDDVGISLSKEGEEMPISDNLEKLFSNDVNSIFYKGKREYLWWPTIIEELGYFLAIIDDDDLEDEDIPAVFKSENPWGDLYDDDDDDEDEAGHYINDYYRRKGLI